jgi:hypothetical protein
MTKPTRNITAHICNNLVHTAQCFFQQNTSSTYRFAISNVPQTVQGAFLVRFIIGYTFASYSASRCTAAVTTTATASTHSSSSRTPYCRGYRNRYAKLRQTFQSLLCLAVTGRYSSRCCSSRYAFESYTANGSSGPVAAAAAAAGAAGAADTAVSAGAFATLALAAAAAVV